MDHQLVYDAPPFIGIDSCVVGRVQESIYGDASLKPVHQLGCDVFVRVDKEDLAEMPDGLGRVQQLQVVNIVFFGDIGLGEFGNERGGFRGQ